MLHHPFSSVKELKSVDYIAYLTFKDAFTACHLHHSHLEDYYTNLEAGLDESLGNDDEENIVVEHKPEDEGPLADFKAYA
jgi:hypothetical protein